MGQFLGKPNSLSGSKNLPPLLLETQLFSIWTIQDVKEVMKKMRTQIFGFCMIESQFESVVSFRSDITNYCSIENLFEILDNDNDGRIDGLEFIAGIAIVCKASFEDKVKLLFEAFDFNLNSSLSKTELTMMITSCVCGMIALTGGGEDNEPELSYFEKVVDEAFQKADRDNSGYVSYEEFIQWARSNRDIMTTLEIMNKINVEANIQDSDDSAEEAEEEDFSDFEPEKHQLTENQKKTDLDNNTKTTSKSNSSSLIESKLNIQNIPQWKLQTAHAEPTTTNHSNKTYYGPDTNLNLKWVHGTNSLGRGNVHFISLSPNNPPIAVVYSSANLGIVYSLETRSQKFYQGHNSQILSIAIHPNQHEVATGDASSLVHIWDALTVTCKVTIQVLASYGVQLLCFSHTGDKIVSVSKDSEQTINVYECASGAIVGSGKGFSMPNKVLDVAYSPANDEIVIVGRKKIRFFRGLNASKRALDSFEGKVSHLWKKRTYFCVEYIGADAVVGCADGSLYIFKGTLCNRVIQAHNLNEPILCMKYKSGVLVTGGKDGLVKSWDSSFKEIGSAIDISEDLDGDGKPDSGSLNVTITSVDLWENQILLCTKSSDIFYALLPRSTKDNLEMTRLATGHFKGELWGLSTHPLREEFATCGDDKTLRIWSLRSHELLSLRILPERARVIAYNNNGDILAIGMENGSVALMESSSSNLRVFSTWSDSSGQITELKFSADSTYLAVGSQDKNIYIYKTSDKKNYKKFSICRGHSNSVNHLDFSVNAQYIRSNSIDLSLFYWDIYGDQIRTPSDLRDVSWASYNCPLSWETKGLWPSRSSNKSGSGSGSGSGGIQQQECHIHTCDSIPDLEVTLAGDSIGKVKLYRYPSPNHKSIGQVHSGHSSMVSNVKFSGNRQYAISIGGVDRGIMVWSHFLERHDSDNENDDEKEAKMPSSFPSIPSGVSFLGAVGDESIALEDISDSSPLLPTSTVSNSWKSSIIEPSDAAFPTGSTDVDLELQWVHGYRASDCRNNLRYSSSGEVVFHAAALAVAYSKSQGVQRFLQGVHYDDITCIAMHPSGEIFATGDEFKNCPKIVVWNIFDVRVLNTIEGGHKNRIGHLTFNAKGDLLASVGFDENNTLMIHDWKTGICIAQTATNTLARVKAFAFLSNNNSPSLSDNNNISMASASGKSLKFWTFCGQNVVSQQAIWGKTNERGRINCIIATGNGLCITATTKGNIYAWSDNEVVFPKYIGDTDNLIDFEKSQKVIFNNPHNSAVQSMWCDDVSYRPIMSSTSRPIRLFSADNDGIISIWEVIVLENDKLKKVVFNLLRIVNLAHLEFKLSSLCVQSICERDHVLLIGTKASEIVEVDWDSKEPFEYKKKHVEDTVTFNSNETVEVKVKPDDINWVGGKIISINDDNSYKVLLSEDRIENSIQSANIRRVVQPECKVGDTVFAKQTSELWALAIVKVINQNQANAYHVEFLNSKEVSQVPSSSIKRVEFSKDEKVKARYKEGPTWYPGRIQDIHDNNLYTILYDDGAVECGIANNLIKKASASEYTYEFNLGDRVTVAEKYDTTFSHTGKIYAININNNSYDICYDDETIELDVYCDRIHKINSTINNQIIKEKLSGQRLNGGHGIGNVSGLSSHPSENWFFTTGYDQTLRFWNASNKKHYLVSYVNLPVKSRSVSVSHNYIHDNLNNVPNVDTNDVAVGMDDGTVLIFPITVFTNPYNTPGVSLGKIDPKLSGDCIPDKLWYNVLKLEDAKLCISEIRYSPMTSEGSLVAIGCHDCSIYLYSLKRGTYTLLSKLENGHKSNILHIDFGILLDRSKEQNFDESSNKIYDGKAGSYIDLKFSDICLQTTSSDKAVVAWLTDGKQITSSTVIKEIFWLTMTSPYNWATQGVWPKENGEPSLCITSVSRAHAYKDVPVLAVADNLGRVKLFNYPCVLEGSPDKEYKGHSSQVTNICFSADDSYCISTGGEDQCIFIWATDVLEELREKNSTGNRGKNSSSTNGISNNQADHFEVEEFNEKIMIATPKGGDEFTALKPWKGSIREPTSFVEDESIGTSPVESLELKFVYGYRSWDCRNNISYADSSEEIVYHIAGVGVVYNSETNTQVHNVEHTDDILCLAVHPLGHTVATGEIGKKPLLVIWDANTGMTLKIIKFHDKGISQVAFTNDGSMIISIGMDDDRMVAIHNVSSGILIGKGKAGKGISIYSIAPGPNYFVTCGKNHVKFWDLPNDNPVGELSSKTGIFGKNVASKTAISVAFLGLYPVTGMADGNLILWKSRASSRIEMAHKGSAVTAMCSLDSGARLASGGKDGSLYIWNSQLVKELELKLPEFSIKSRLPQIQALNYRGGRIIIGTKASEIYEVDIRTPDPNSITTVKLVEGHYVEDAEIWGLASHPKQNIFATASDDKTVRIWDTRTKQPKTVFEIPAKSRALAFSFDGTQLATGLVDGKVIILNAAGDFSSILSSVQVCKKAIHVLKYSPDDKVMAVGADDAKIYLLDTKTFGSRAICVGHHSTVTHIDFSRDAVNLQSVSSDYELLFWDVATGKQRKSPSEVRDVAWNSFSCILGWPVQGIWPPNADGTDVNAVCRSPDEKTIATGDDFGKVKIFRYPSSKENAKFKEYKGHSAHVTNVCFSSDGKYLFSTGGLDKSIFQFEVKKG